MRTIIAGSRGVTRPEIVQAAMAASGFKVTEVVSGGARGVDRLGEQWATHHGIPFVQFIPDWDGKGKGAGYARNVSMAEYGNALVAIWDGESRGTLHMIRSARQRHLRIFVYVPHETLLTWVSLTAEEVEQL